MLFLWILLVALILAGTVIAALLVRRRGLGRWLPGYAATAHRRRPVRSNEPVHVLLCIADHFEPKHAATFSHVPMQRVEHWLEEYPRLCGRFRDSDGRPPRHTFF